MEQDNSSGITGELSQKQKKYSTLKKHCQVTEAFLVKIV